MRFTVVCDGVLWNGREFLQFSMFCLFVYIASVLILLLLVYNGPVPIPNCPSMYGTGVG